VTGSMTPTSSASPRNCSPHDDDGSERPLDRLAGAALSSAGMAIEVIRDPLPLARLRDIAQSQFGDVVKAVVDVQRGVIAIGGELHADEESLLLEEGARQADLWGINLYPDRPAAEMIEFDSLINVRPSQGNRSRSVEDRELQRRIRDVVARLIGA